MQAQLRKRALRTIAAAAAYAAVAPTPNNASTSSAGRVSTATNASISSSSAGDGPAAAMGAFPFRIADKRAAISNFEGGGMPRESFIGPARLRAIQFGIGYSLPTQ